MKQTLISFGLVSLFVISSNAFAGDTCSEWKDGVSYKNNDVVSFNGLAYISLTSHFSPPGAGWNPISAPSLWQQGGSCQGVENKTICSQWKENIFYKVGDLVVYKEKTYASILEHTAYQGAGWNPESANTLWSNNGACDIFIIDQNGGTIEKQETIKATFGKDSLSKKTAISIKKTNDGEVQETFERSSDLFNITKRSEYEIRVILSDEQPSKPVNIDVSIPKEFKSTLSSEDEVRILYLSVYDDGNERLDSFDLLPERKTNLDSSISSTLPIEAFYLNEDGKYEATLIVSATKTARNSNSGNVNIFNKKSVNATSFPETILPPIVNKGIINLAAAQGSVCEGSAITAPIKDGRITSDFGPRTKPNSKASSLHAGIDYGVAPGAPILAASDGTVIFKVQRNKKKQVTGWGHYAIVKHADGGATLYAHLTPGSGKFENNAAVKAGEVIALSGNSGNTTGPHLHFEYAPSGKIYKNDNKVDPQPCVEQLVLGAISVRDNGSVADDAFTVSLDGVNVCKTEIGAANNCSLGNLRKGSYVLGVYVDIAPDGVGTYEVTVNSENMTVNGGKSVSGYPPEGTTDNYSLVVQ